MRGYGSKLLMISGYNLPISLGHHGLGLSSGDLFLSSDGLCHLQERGPYNLILQKEEDSTCLGHHSNLPQEEELDNHGEDLLHWQSSLQVFVLHSFECSFPIITIIGLDAKAYNKYTLMA